jgi:hypothetical protein
MKLKKKNKATLVIDLTAAKSRKSEASTQQCLIWCGEIFTPGTNKTVEDTQIKLF